MPSLVGSEMCIRDRYQRRVHGQELETVIERLLRELAEKKGELDGVNKELDGVTHKINSITSKFETQLNRLSVKRTKVDEEVSQFNRESEALDARVVALENSEKDMTGLLQKFENYLKEVGELRVNLLQQGKELADLSEQRAILLHKFQRSLNAFNETKSSTTRLEISITQYSEQKEIFTAKLGDLTTQKNTLSQKIPSLEADKKAAVSSRNFKAASQITNELKDIQSQIDEFERNIGDVNNKLLDLESNIQKAKGEIEGNRYELQSLEEKADIDKFEYLIIKERDLKELIEFCKLYSHLEEHTTLESELTICQGEIQQLRNRYPSKIAAMEAAKKPKETLKPVTNVNNDVITPTTQVDTMAQNDLLDLDFAAPAPVPSQVNPDNNNNNSNNTLINADLPEDNTPISPSPVSKQRSDLELTQEEFNALDLDKKREIVNKVLEKIGDNHEALDNLNKELEDAIAKEQFEEAEKIDQNVQEKQNQNDTLINKLMEWGFQDKGEAFNFANSSSTAGQPTTVPEPYNPLVNEEAVIQNEDRSPDPIYMFGGKPVNIAEPSDMVIQDEEPLEKPEETNLPVDGDEVNSGVVIQEELI
eukprot:TRINITY_DN438_c0_g1_i8.p1 TRINITY_DN438_c0_g1~~TRINITY_DN438_c0_g1_i8.p1  ORF type:complete len:592 (-),score=193.48 TRINITY_DN438_c0_g1_i8:246-2021(-)